MTSRRVWTVGASVRLKSVGMLNVPRPFGTLSVVAERITLEVRPAFLTSRLPGRPWVVTPADGAAIFPVRGSAFYRGVGVQRGSQKPFYFWCGRALPDVLAAIEAAGFPVEMVERRPVYR